MAVRAVLRSVAGCFDADLPFFAFFAFGSCSVTISKPRFCLGPRRSSVLSSVGGGISSSGLDLVSSLGSGGMREDVRSAVFLFDGLDFVRISDAALSEPRGGFMSLCSGGAICPARSSSQPSSRMITCAASCMYGLAVGFERRGYFVAFSVVLAGWRAPSNRVRVLLSPEPMFGGALATEEEAAPQWPEAMLLVGSLNA